MPSFSHLADLGAARVGGRAVAANDEFFAPKESLLKSGPRRVHPGKVHVARQVDGRMGDPPEAYPGPRLVRDPTGHARDRARHRRRHEPLHRQLPRSAARWTPAADAGTASKAALLGPKTEWIELLPLSRLQGGAQNLFPIAHPDVFTHVRLNIHPDGGVARLRVYGEVAVDWPARARSQARFRPRGDPERRPRARGQRHALRLEGQPHHARPREEHGRRLGNAAAPRARATTG